MESQQYGLDGVQGTAGQAYNVAAPPAAQYGAKVPASSMSLPGYVLRIIVIVLTLVSTVVMGIARETVTLYWTDIAGFTTSETRSTKSTYSAAFVYFIVANVLVFFYSAISLALSIANKASISGMLLPFAIGDVVMVALLFSSNGAAAAISFVLGNGQENLAGWTKICVVVGGFCARVNASIALSMIASLVYVLLVVLGAVALRRSY